MSPFPSQLDLVPYSLSFLSSAISFPQSLWVPIDVETSPTLKNNLSHDPVSASSCFSHTWLFLSFLPFTENFWWLETLVTSSFFPLTSSSNLTLNHVDYQTHWLSDWSSPFRLHCSHPCRTTAGPDCFSWLCRININYQSYITISKHPGFHNLTPSIITVATYCGPTTYQALVIRVLLILYLIHNYSQQP